MMKLQENETVLIKRRADTMYWNLIRRGSYTLVITDRRLLLTSLFGIKREYELEEIDSVTLYRVTFFLPFGMRLTFCDGSKLELAIVNRQAVLAVLSRVCPQLAEKTA